MGAKGTPAAKRPSRVQPAPATTAAETATATAAGPGAPTTLQSTPLPTTSQAPSTTSRPVASPVVVSGPKRVSIAPAVASGPAGAARPPAVAAAPTPARSRPKLRLAALPPLMPMGGEDWRLGTPAGVCVRRHPHGTPSPFLHPMAIGPTGSPELVAFPSNWLARVHPSRQQPAQLTAPRGSGESRGPDTVGRSPGQKSVYPVLELGRFTEYGDLVEPSPINPPSTPLLPRRDESEECGFFGYRPEWLRRFREPGWVLVSLCAIELTQSFVNSGVLSVVLPTIERRFNLSSFETGIILSAFNVVNCVFIVPVAFLGSTRNKPVIIASGMALASAGSFTFFLAYALAPSYA